MSVASNALRTILLLCTICSTFGFVGRAGPLPRSSSCLRGCSVPFIGNAVRLRSIARAEVQYNGKMRGVKDLMATLPHDIKGKARLEKFMEDCALLGPMRFVCMSDASILEAVGSFENLRHSDQSKGRYATVSTVGFECHINTNKIHSVHMITKKSPSGEYDMYITRFLDEGGATVLSAILDGQEGSYEPGATEYWEKLRETFGAEQLVAE